VTSMPISTPRLIRHGGSMRRAAVGESTATRTARSIPGRPSPPRRQPPKSSPPSGHATPPASVGCCRHQPTWRRPASRDRCSRRSRSASRQRQPALPPSPATRSRSGPRPRGTTCCPHGPASFRPAPPARQRISLPTTTSWRWSTPAPPAARCMSGRWFAAVMHGGRSMCLRFRVSLVTSTNRSLSSHRGSMDLPCRPDPRMIRG